MVLDNQIIWKIIELTGAGIIFSVIGFAKNKQTRRMAIWLLIIYLIIIGLLN